MRLIWNQLVLQIKIKIFITGATETYRAQELCRHFETEVMVPDQFGRHFLNLYIINGN